MTQLFYAYSTADARHRDQFEKQLQTLKARGALDAAASVGDDRIQRQMQGRVTPESWTHGSAEQRMTWFSTGYEAGSLDSCNTLRGRV